MQGLALLLLATLQLVQLVQPLPLTIIHQPNHALHAPPPGTPHAERPDRLDAIMDELTSSNLGATIITSSNPLARVESAINATHSSYYLKNLRKTVGGLNSDTYVAPDSYRTILTATSCWLSALDLASSYSGPAFALTRPPGHHATKEAGMGFCLVNFCACSALEFLKENENKRVAVLDIDVHFGNGSADILKGLKRARFASVHERGIYPGSGESKAEGENVLKLPVPSGCLGPEWLEHVNQALEFVLADDPDLLIVSVGYDALSEDPLAGLNLTPDNYAEAMGLITGRFPKSRTFFGLEGGYALSATATAVRKSCEALM